MKATLGLLLVLTACPPDRLTAQTADTTEPVTFVQRALARHRVVFLGDVHPIAEPKWLVVELIERQDVSAPIDMLALEVGADQQEVIDQYLASAPEDTTILMAHPRTLRVHWGASSDYLAIYRAAYRWNHEHPARPTRVIAADVRGWPVAPLTEHMASGAFANRDEWMARAFEKTIAAHPGWRTLVFMGGYHGLKTGGGEVRVGKAHDRFDHWFAGYLTDAQVDVYTVLTDARQESGRGATRVFELLSAEYPGRNVAVPLDSATDAVREPLYDVEQQDYHLEFWPSRFALRTAADAMLVLTRTTPIRLLGGS
jgi:hypothetical protein